MLKSARLGCPVLGQIKQISAICALLTFYIPVSPVYAELNIGLRSFQSSELEADGGLPAEDIERREILLDYAFNREGLEPRFGYSHRPFRIRDGNPASNGYWHQFDAGLRNTFQQTGTTLDLSAGLHGSSNMFKYTDFDGGAVVPKFAISQALPSFGIEGLGIAGNHNFGDFIVYPVLTLNFPLLETAQVQFELPNSVYLEERERLWRFGIERYGEKWRALDKEREVRSDFLLNEWRVRCELAPAFPSTAIRMVFEAGVSFETEVEYRDLDRGTLERSQDPAFFGGVGLRISP